MSPLNPRLPWICWVLRTANKSQSPAKANMCMLAPDKFISRLFEHRRYKFFWSLGKLGKSIMVHICLLLRPKFGEDKPHFPSMRTANSISLWLSWIYSLGRAHSFFSLALLSPKIAGRTPLAAALSIRLSQVLGNRTSMLQYPEQCPPSPLSHCRMVLSSRTIREAKHCQAMDRT